MSAQTKRISRDFRIVAALCLASAVLFALASESSTAQQGEEKPKAAAGSSSSIPQWALDYFKFRTAGTGRWLADNAKYKGANEPFDEYVTEWTWSAGKQSIKGRLFGLTDKKESAPFFEFRMHWHPGDRKVITQAFGAGGSYALGELKQGDSKSEVRIEHTVYLPDGSSFREWVKEIDSADQFQTEDFRWKDGKWQPLRSYVWQRVPTRIFSP